MASSLLAIAEDLESGRPAQDEQSSAVEDDAQTRLLGAIALSISSARARRQKYFRNHLLGEPAWDMLLALFIARVEGRQLSTTSACVAAQAPTTTAMRALDVLERDSMVRRYRIPSDRRLAMVELTDAGFDQLKSYFSEGVQKQEMPLPG